MTEASGPEDHTAHARQQAHATLAAALRAQRVRLGVNVGLANRPGSPVFIRSESAIPLFLSFFGVIAATMLGGPMLGLLALGLAGAMWLLFIHPRLRDRVYERSLAYVLGGVGELERMWQAGAISLQTANGEREVRGPQGDWVEFTESLPTDVPTPE
jgi:hypothetical protein